MQQTLTPYQSLYYAWLLTRRAAGDSVESLASTLVDSQVDLNPHQVEAALFACANPLSRGVILADEVGLGKTIEAGLVISQRWAERRRRILIIVPANLRKQWHQELQDKFNLQGVLLEAKSFNALRKQDRRNPFQGATGPVICSYQFAKAKAAEHQADRFGGQRQLGTLQKKAASRSSIRLNPRCGHGPTCRHARQWATPNGLESRTEHDARHGGRLS